MAGKCRKARRSVAGTPVLLRRAVSWFPPHRTSCFSVFTEVSANLFCKNACVIVCASTTCSDCMQGRVQCREFLAAVQCQRGAASPVLSCPARTTLRNCGAKDAFPPCNAVHVGINGNVCVYLWNAQNGFGSDGAVLCMFLWDLCVAVVSRNHPINRITNQWRLPTRMSLDLHCCSCSVTF